MTRAACAVILHVSTLRLTWRSVKSLKLPAHTMDTEILISWSLVSFHWLFAPLERVLSYLPFYYYAKLIVLIATFLPGTKIPNVWLDVVLVPGIELLHRWLDVDVRDRVFYQARMLPWQVVDLVLLPGILPCDNGLKEKRRSQLAEARSKMPFRKAEEVVGLGESVLPPGDGSIPSSDQVTADGSNMVERQHPVEGLVESSIVSPFERTQRRVSNRTSPQKKPPLSPRSPSSLRRLSEISENSSRKEIKWALSELARKSSSVSSPAIRSRLVASSMHLRKFSQEHQPVIPSLSGTISFSRPSENGTNMLPPSPSQEDSNQSIEMIKSRSKFHTCSTPLFPKTSPTCSSNEQTPRSETLFSEKRESGASDHFSFRLNSHGDETNEDSNKKKKESRKSLGAQVREFVTGDAHIRMRDYMFDLDLPSLPTPRFSGGSDISEATFTSPRVLSVERNRPRSTRREDEEMTKKKEREGRRRRKPTGAVLHRHMPTEADSPFLSVSTSESTDKRLTDSISHSSWPSDKPVSMEKCVLCEKTTADEKVGDMCDFVTLRRSKR